MDPATPERPKRKALLSNAHGARDDGAPIEVRVRNLSDTGLGGVATQTLARGERIRIEIKGIGEIAGCVAWARGVSFGMVFDQPVDTRKFEVAAPFLPIPDHYSVNRRFRPVRQIEFKRPGFYRA